MSAAVLTALTEEQELAVLSELDRLRGTVQVTRRCADAAELLAAAQSGLGTVAVASASFRGLDRETIAQLHYFGLRVLIVGSGHPGAAMLGADALSEVAGLSDALPVLVQTHQPRPVNRRGTPGPRPNETHPPRPGRRIAVVGPHGAPGRSVIALNLAADLANGHVTCLLVDADTYGASQFTLLGLLDESAGLAGAARAALAGQLNTHSLAELTVAVGPLRLLTGIPRAERWSELPASAMEVVFDVAHLSHEWVVADCGFSLERDEALMYDTHAPQRNATTLAAISQADEVVVVGRADPIGLARLVRSLQELRELAPAACLRVVVNQVRASATGGSQAIRDLLARYASVENPILLPWDQAALDRAIMQGRTLIESAPRSALSRAIASLSAALRASQEAVQRAQ